MKSSFKPLFVAFLTAFVLAGFALAPVAEAARAGSSTADRFAIEDGAAAAAFPTSARADVPLPQMRRLGETVKPVARFALAFFMRA